MTDLVGKSRPEVPRSAPVPKRKDRQEERKNEKMEDRCDPTRVLCLERPREDLLDADDSRLATDMTI